jgi:transketolase
MDAVQKANSGHPGTPMALAPVAFTVFDKFMRFNPADPEWPNRDRFVLSAGHASMLLYSLLHIMGYDLTLEDLKEFRQLHSRTAGHPEFGLTSGVEMTTGPLGQGVGTSVGMAIAEKWLKSYFNRPDHDIIDYRIFALASDGDIMEGISHEAASLAGHLALGNLVWLYDSNSITIEGSTALAFSENVAARFHGYGWHVQNVDDANDLKGLEDALKSAIDEKDKASLIIIKSHIAYGAPNKQDTADAHGSPLGEHEIMAAKKNYGWPEDKKFYVPEEIKPYTKKTREKGAKLQTDWDSRFADYEKALPDLAAEFRRIQDRKLPDGWESVLPEFPSDKDLATRQSNGKILNALAEKIPWLLGGSGDLMPSTKTKITASGDFEKTDYGARNLHFGIREHAMGAIVNGMSLSKLRSFGATFLIFSDYMRPAIRLAALMGTPSIFIFTHDSIGLGEDGPTHQPVEHLAALRAIPNLDLIRPADANELSVLWKHILESKDRPMALALTRQKVPTFDRSRYSPAEGALKGAYVLADSDGRPDIILMASGSEVHLCLEACEKLGEQGIKARVVSMPCWSLFDRQSEDYRRSVLPESVPARVAVEAGVTFGWERYTGNNGMILGLNRFGMSAPYEQIYSELGLTVENIMAAARKAMQA